MNPALSARIKRGPLDDVEREQIATLFERGFSMGRIADKISRHPATINNELLRIGARGFTGHRTTAYRRGKSLVRPFTPDEDAWIEALRVQGFSWARIGELCGKRYGHSRNPSTIGTRLRQLAGRHA